uniref:Putative rhomboid-like protease 4 isoform X2 n=1 Tax=Davidia involucrata TaxID=16924 RepID=A0A5B7CCZ1_DAVIN
MDKERQGENRSDSEIRNLSESGSVTPLAKKQFPWLVMTLIVTHWTIFIISLYKNNCPARSGDRECILPDILGRFSFENMKQNRQLGPSIATLQEMGGLEWKPGDKDTKRWHIFTSIFIHRGLASLILSTASLLYGAIGLERTFGVGKESTI